MDKAVKTIVVGAGILLLQHFLAAEGESWLVRMGLWPRS